PLTLTEHQSIDGLEPGRRPRRRTSEYRWRGAGAEAGRSRLQGTDRGRSPSRPEGLPDRNSLPQPNPEGLPVGPTTTTSGKNGTEPSHPDGTSEHRRSRPDRRPRRPLSHLRAVRAGMAPRVVGRLSKPSRETRTAWKAVLQPGRDPSGNRFSSSPTPGTAC